MLVLAIVAAMKPAASSPLLFAIITLHVKLQVATLQMVVCTLTTLIDAN